MVVHNMNRADGAPLWSVELIVVNGCANKRKGSKVQRDQAKLTVRQPICDRRLTQIGGACL